MQSFARNDGPTLTVDIAGYLPTLDPAVCYWTLCAMIIDNCYDGLLAPGGPDLVPALATEKPTVENGGISSDGLTYRFHVRPGATFSDGRPLTARDVEYSIERIMVYDDPDGPAWMFEQVLTGGSRDAIASSVETHGNDVIFHLVQPYSPFLEILATSTASVVSKQWAVSHGDWPGTPQTMSNWYHAGPSALATETMGDGPFTLRRWTSDAVELVRNDDYWQPPAITKLVELPIVPDPDQQVSEFLAGDTDMLLSTPSSAYDELDAADDVRAYKGLPTLEVDVADLNRDIQPTDPATQPWDYQTFCPDAPDGTPTYAENCISHQFFKDDDVRKAFAYAVDYDGIIANVFGGDASQPASPVIAGLPYSNPDQPKYAHDPATAETYFQQVANGELWNSGFTMTLVYPNEFVVRKLIEKSIKAQIEAINPKFHVNVEGLPLSAGSGHDFLEAWLGGYLPIDLDGWAADYRDPDDFVTPYMQSTGDYAALNHYSDPNVDALVADGRFETDPAARQATYYQLQQIFHDETIGLPLAQPTARHYEHTWVHGYAYNGFQPTEIDFYPIWQDRN